MTLFRGVFLSFLLIPSSYALKKFSLDLGLDSRSFTSVENDNVETNNFTLNIDASLKAKEDVAKIVLEFYAQVDPIDSERNFIIPKDLWFAIDNGTHIFKAGFQIINWSATEAFHPVDVINSRFLDSSILKPSKIGEPIISYKLLFGESSSITLMYLPYFTDPIYPTESSGYGPGFEVDEIQIYDQGSSFESDNFINQYAAQFSSNFKGTDFSLSYINYVDRNFPFFSLSTIKVVNSNPVPVFDSILFKSEQLGITSQSVIGDWLFKTEIAFINWDREATSNPVFPIDDHTIVALGLEKNFAIGGGSDFSLIIEHQYYYGIDDDLLATILFQNDLLLGFRLAFNDVNSKAIFFSVISDLDSGEQFMVNFNYSQRFMESWKFETGLQFVDSKIDGNYIGLELIDNSDHIYFNIKKYF